MRKIEIVPGASPDLLRMLLCGLSGSGKTHFAATSPRPLFISDASEGGYKTIQAMDPELWWNPKVRPEVWIIEAYTDMSKAISELEAMAAAKKFPYQTLIIDPLSVYVDRFLSELMAQDIYKDNRKYYGDLSAHLQALTRRVHALPCHVMWLCHVKHDGSEINGPAIGGQMAEKFPALCDFAWLMNVVTSPNNAPVYELRTKPYRTWTFLKGRWELYDPMLPSMKVVHQILGFKEQPASPAVPGFPQGVFYPSLNKQQQQQQLPQSQPNGAAPAATPNVARP